MSDISDLPVMGGCLCTAVSFRITGPLAPVMASHSEQSRRLSGHYAAYTWTVKDSVEIEGKVKWYRALEGERLGFCPTCGSSLFSEAGDGKLWICAGSLDAPTGIALSEHVHTASKGDYYTLDDDLPKAK